MTGRLIKDAVWIRKSKYTILDDGSTWGSIGQVTYWRQMPEISTHKDLTLKVETSINKLRFWLYQSWLIHIIVNLMKLSTELPGETKQSSSAVADKPARRPASRQTAKF